MTMTMGPGSIEPGYRVTTIDRLRETIGALTPATRTKLRTTFDPFSLQFIESSPCVGIAFQGTDGQADTSPRGDEPGVGAATFSEEFSRVRVPSWGPVLNDDATSICNRRAFGQ